MRIFNKTTAVAAMILVCATIALASDALTGAEEAFHQAFPQVQVDSIKPTDIKGLFEIISGPNIYYYFQEKDYLFAGNIYQKGGRNITGEKRAELAKKIALHAVQMAKKLPLDKAIKIGKGKKVVIEFTDPECTYCRKASEFLSKREDITLYAFFSPFAHPGAINKICYILGSDNKASAYADMMHGKEIPPSAPAADERSKALAAEHMALAQEVGVAATPTFFIKDQMVVGADLGKLEQLLKD